MIITQLRRYSSPILNYHNKHSLNYNIIKSIRLSSQNLKKKIANENINGFKWEAVSMSILDKKGDKIYEMYENNYKKIGIIDYGGWNGLKNKFKESYLLTDEKSEIKGLIPYQLTKYGNQLSLSIGFNCKISQNYLYSKFIELFKSYGFYAELSQSIEYILRKYGLDNIKQKKIIKKINPKLKDEDIFDEDDERCKIYPMNKYKNIPSPSGSYLKEFKNIGLQRKALYGLPWLDK